MTRQQRAYQQLVKRIEKSNQKFQEASKSERIVMVAKDVLAMLKLGKMHAQTGTYFLTPPITNSPLALEGNCQLNDLLKMPELPACDVCAIGGAMMATALRSNEVKVDCHSLNAGIAGVYLNPDERKEDAFKESANPAAYELGSKMAIKTEKVFPPALLRAMEQAFEHRYFGYEDGDPTQRMEDVYRNLIRNKGKKFTWKDTFSHIPVWQA